MDLGASSIKSPSISTARSAPVVPAPSAPALRQSPSTPAGLGSQVTHRSRPKTYYSDREPPLPTSPNLSAVPLAQQPQANRASHYKVPSGGSTIPKGRDSRFLSADDWSDTEDLWAPASPASGNLRPFSFAVRAGAGGNGSESSHNRRSFFGRFGGSVTSLFTGHTHGGSGSMMDMHLGLESDRRNRTSSYQTHEAPRVQTSLSPSRAPYSRQSSMYFAHQDEQPGSATPTTASAAAERPRSRSRSVSGSRLTQVSLFDDVDDEPAKKKGFKGLLQKMKGGSKTKRDRASTLVGINISPRPDEDVTQLAPPPPMAYLVNHNRQRSGSSSTVDDQSTPALSPQTATTASGARSVSAPMGTSSSGSISPTSSRFQGDRQDSQAPPRRRGEPALELPPGAADSAFQQRNSVMEMLSGSTASGVNAPVTPDTPVYDEPQQFGARESVMIPNGQPGQHPQHPQVPAGYRKTKQSSLSSRYSTSTTTVPLETPDQSASALYLVPHQQSSPPNHTSRQKTLPPLPPPGVGVFPDMYIDHEPQSSYTSRGSMYSAHTGASYPRASMMEPRLSTIDPRMSYVDPRSSMYDSPTVHRAALPPSADYFPTASGRHHAASPVNVAPDYVAPPKALGRTVQPRASFDMLNRRHGSNNSASMAMSNDDLEPPQGMYMQRGAAASTGSFGRFLKGNDAARNTVMNSVPQTEDKKERRRGIKSIFGKRA